MAPKPAIGSASLPSRWRQQQQQQHPHPHPQQPKTITVIGSINTDLVARTPRFPGPGETLALPRDGGFEVSQGGKGANQAVACVRLAGVRRREEEKEEKEDRGAGSTNDNAAAITVTMHAAIASDAFGPAALDALRANAIDTTAVHVLPAPPHSTGLALVLVDAASGENRILLHAGANAALTPRMVREKLPRPLGVWEPGLQGEKREASMPNVVVMQLEVPVEVVVAVVGDVDRVRKEGAAEVDVVFNPAPAPAGGLEDLKGLEWRAVRHLIMNESEAGILAGLGEVEELDVQKVSDMFIRLGVKCVVITLGGKGLYYHRKREIREGSKAPVEGNKSGDHDKNDEYSGFIPALKVNVVDTTAAGDTFVGAYAIEVARYQGQVFDLRHACTIANWAAAKTVERPGAQASIPWLDEIGDIPSAMSATYRKT